MFPLEKRTFSAHLSSPLHLGLVHPAASLAGDLQVVKSKLPAQGWLQGTRWTLVLLRVCPNKTRCCLSLEYYYRQPSNRQLRTSFSWAEGGAHLPGPPIMVQVLITRRLCWNMFCYAGGDEWLSGFISPPFSFFFDYSAILPPFMQSPTVRFLMSW